MHRQFLGPSPSTSLAAASRISKNTVAACVAVLLLSSCASFKGIASTAQIHAPSDLTSSATLPAQGGAWPSLAWPGSIGGTSLQALVDEALTNNPGLQIAAARIASAQAVAEAAGAAERPSINGVAGSTLQRFSEHGLVPPPLGGMYKTDNQLLLNFAYDFDFWGKHAAELRAALSQGKAAEAERYAARLVLTTSVARAWFQLAREYAQLDLTQQQLLVRQKIDHLTELRVNAGLDTESDVQQAHQQLAGLRVEQAQWQGSIALTRNQLAALLGQGPDRGRAIVRPDMPSDVATALPDELPLTLLGRRPDIVAARWRVEAAQGNIAAAKTQFYPNVNLSAFAGLSSIGLSNLLKYGSRVVGIGPAIRLPLFETGTLRAHLKGDVASYDAAVATYNQTLTDALHDVADQVQSLRAVAEQGEQQHAATLAAASAVKLAQQREKIGTANMLPALANEWTLLAQRKTELDLHARRIDLQIALIKSMGGGFDAAAQGLDTPVAATTPAATLNPPTLAKSSS